MVEFIKNLFRRKQVYIKFEIKNDSLDVTSCGIDNPYFKTLVQLLMDSKGRYYLAEHIEKFSRNKELVDMANSLAVTYDTIEQAGINNIQDKIKIDEDQPLVSPLMAYKGVASYIEGKDQ